MGRHNSNVHAERLVALEAAFAELGDLYTAARSFTRLQAQAENDLLPRLASLAARLRALHRRGRISQTDIDAASREILDVRTRWQDALQAVRDCASYRAAIVACRGDDQGELERLIPEIFAGVRPVPAPRQLYFALSAATRRRGPGSSPFLDPAACADKIALALRDGLVPHSGDNRWWDDDLPWLPCTDAPGALDTPFSLELAGTELRKTLFASDDDLGYRVYTPRLTGAFVACIASEIDDEWWQAYERPYAEFRDQLCACLGARSIIFRTTPTTTRG